MTVTEFFEYLHDHPTTASLADTIAAVLGVGRRPGLVPIRVPNGAGPRRELTTIAWAFRRTKWPE